MATRKRVSRKSASRKKITRKKATTRKSAPRRGAAKVARIAKRASRPLLEKSPKKAPERDQAKKTLIREKPRVVARTLAKPRRVARRSSPIPDPDVPTPAQTSSHGPFDGRSRRDPDKILAGEKVLNEKFAEEDEYTNKTGNPRIGTRGRTYTP